MIKARKRSFRSALRIWHRWFGIVVGIWLLLLAVSGCVITWYNEVDTALNPDWRSLEQSTPANVKIENLVAKSEAHLPGATFSMIQYPSHDKDTFWLFGRAPNPQGGFMRVQVFAHPQTGDVLGWRESGKISLDRRHFADFFYGFHTDFLLGPIAAWVIGLIGLLWVFDHIASLILSFPKGAKVMSAFKIKGKRLSLRRLFDWHRAKGVWAFPLTLTVAFTGLVLSWPGPSRILVNNISPITGRLHETWPDLKPLTTPISIDAAIDISGTPKDKIHSLRFYPDHHAYAIRTFDEKDVDNQGRLWTYVSMVDGRQVAQRHDVGVTAGDKFFSWQYALHSGHAFGLVGRILIFISGLIVIALFITGLKLVFRRRRK